jgi:hypothetical protein
MRRSKAFATSSGASTTLTGGDKGEGVRRWKATVTTHWRGTLIRSACGSQNECAAGRRLRRRELRVERIEDEAAQNQCAAGRRLRHFHHPMVDVHLLDTSAVRRSAPLEGDCDSQGPRSAFFETTGAVRRSVPLEGDCALRPAFCKLAA